MDWSMCQLNDVYRTEKVAYTGLDYYEGAIWLPIYLFANFIALQDRFKYNRASERIL